MGTFRSLLPVVLGAALVAGCVQHGADRSRVPKPRHTVVVKDADYQHPEPVPPSLPPGSPGLAPGAWEAYWQAMRDFDRARADEVARRNKPKAALQPRVELDMADRAPGHAGPPMRALPPPSSFLPAGQPPPRPVRRPVPEPAPDPGAPPASPAAVNQAAPVETERKPDDRAAEEVQPSSLSVPPPSPGRTRAGLLLAP
jgi:hypothetical protein